MADSTEHLTHQYLQEKGPMIFIACALDGTIMEANAYATSIAGYPLVNHNFQDLVVDFQGDFDFARLVQDEAQEHLLNINMHDGLPQSFYFHFQATRDKVLAFGRLDAEELQHMRRELLSLNRDLSDMTRLLHKKNSQLEKLNAEKNQFLGMAAHDLRKPIGLIITYSEFLLDETADVLGGEHTGFLNTINRSCSFMKRLVDDFLDVSAIEAGKFDLNLAPGTVDAVLDTCLTMINLKAEQKGVVIEMRREEGLPSIDIDAPKIEQVILNIVANAIEHTQPDGRIWIGLRGTPDAVEFSVRDQGPGIAKEDMDKLFTAYSTTKAVKTAGEKSTGLGLVISRKIIEAHQGEIRVDSEPGKGTAMTFILPKKDVTFGK